MLQTYRGQQFLIDIFDTYVSCLVQHTKLIQFYWIDNLDTYSVNKKIRYCMNPSSFKLGLLYLAKSRNHEISEKFLKNITATLIMIITKFQKTIISKISK